MTLEQLKTIGNDFIKAVKEYKDSNEYNEVELEIVIDNLLCDLPRDMIYVEWFDRSDIRNMADGIYDDPVNADTVDNCMFELWEYDNNMMDFDIAQSIISDTVRQEHKGADNDD